MHRTTASPRKAQASADPYGGVTGKAAAQALQAHIQEKGTADVQTIARLRRASLQADAGPVGQAQQAASAAMMAAAASAIDEGDEQSESGAMSVTFVEPGSLGLKFTPNQQTGNTEVLAVNPGTQASRHPQLQAGLVLTHVGRSGVLGRPYAQTLELLKSSGRPVTL